MSYTSGDISALNNSMEAARLFGDGLGTELNNISGSIATIEALPQLTSGSISPASASEIVTTGLSTVSSIVATLSGSPTLEHAFVSAVSGSTAGDVIIYCWKPTSDSDVTPVASTGSFVDINWIAVGT
jgi:hypothetical protein